MPWSVPVREPSADDLTRLAAVQRTLQRLVMRASDQDFGGLSLDDAADAELHEADRTALLEGGSARLGIYRRLVRATFIDTLRSEVPMTAGQLGARYAPEVHAFCNEELPRSPVLRDVAFEFVAWATPRWATDASLRPWLGDLARFELLEFDTHCGVRGTDVKTVAELPADRPLVFDGTCRIGRFDYAVHELPDDESPLSEPRAERHGMFLYRDPGNRVRRIVLTPVAAAIMTELLVGGRALADAVRIGTAAEGCTLNTAVIEGISVILEDLATRGALLGSTDSPPPRGHALWTSLVTATRVPSGI